MEIYFDVAAVLRCLRPFSSPALPLVTLTPYHHLAPSIIIIPLRIPLSATLSCICEVVGNGCIGWRGEPWLLLVSARGNLHICAPRQRITLPLISSGTAVLDSRSSNTHLALGATLRLRFLFLFKLGLATISLIILLILIKCKLEPFLPLALARLPLVLRTAGVTVVYRLVLCSFFFLHGMVL